MTEIKEHVLQVSTNLGNAIRYVLFTLALIPLAEKLWTLTHSRRTGSRYLQGQKVQLRQSHLAHWGLHQEVDEKSRISRLLAFMVCILHITGTLLLEFGSGSKLMPVWDKKLISPSLRDSSHLRSDKVYFFDAGYALRNRIGGKRCIDGSPFSTSDFGLLLRSVGKPRKVSGHQLQRSLRKTDILADYYVSNAGRHIQVFGNKKYLSFSYKTQDFVKNFAMYQNVSIGCWQFYNDVWLCEKSIRKTDEKELVREALARTAISKSWLTNVLWYKRRGSQLVCDLNRVNVFKGLQIDKAATAWIRSGMPIDGAPRKYGVGRIELSTSILNDNCNHSYSIPFSYAKQVTILRKKVYLIESAEFRSIPHLSELVYVFGNKIVLGALSQSRKESCAIFRTNWMCISQYGRRKIEVTSFHQRTAASNDTMVSLYPKWSFTAAGFLRRWEMLDIAAQMAIENARHDFLFRLSSLEDQVNSAASMMASGKMASGCIRTFGPGVKGKCVPKHELRATINTLGLVGVGIVLLLVAVPISGLCIYRQKFVVNFESYARGFE